MRNEKPESTVQRLTRMIKTVMDIRLEYTNTSPDTKRKMLQQRGATDFHLNALIVAKNKAVKAEDKNLKAQEDNLIKEQQDIMANIMNFDFSSVIKQKTAGSSSSHAATLKTFKKSPKTSSKSTSLASPKRSSPRSPSVTSPHTPRRKSPSTSSGNSRNGISAKDLSTLKLPKTGFNKVKSPKKKK